MWYIIEWVSVVGALCYQTGCQMLPHHGTAVVPSEKYQLLTRQRSLQSPNKNVLWQYNDEIKKKKMIY